MKSSIILSHIMQHRHKIRQIAMFPFSYFNVFFHSFATNRFMSLVLLSCVFFIILYSLRFYCCCWCYAQKMYIFGYINKTIFMLYNLKCFPFLHRIEFLRLTFDYIDVNVCVASLHRKTHFCECTELFWLNVIRPMSFRFEKIWAGTTQTCIKATERITRTRGFLFAKSALTWAMICEQPSREKSSICHATKNPPNTHIFMICVHIFLDWKKTITNKRNETRREKNLWEAVSARFFLFGSFSESMFPWLQRP